MNKSKFLSLNKKDVLKSLQVVLISTALPSLIVVLNEGRFPNASDFEMIAFVTLGAWVSYIVKNWLTNSNDEFLKHEQS